MNTHHLGAQQCTSVSIQGEDCHSLSLQWVASTLQSNRIQAGQPCSCRALAVRQGQHAAPGARLVRLAA